MWTVVVICCPLLLDHWFYSPVLLKLRFSLSKDEGWVLFGLNNPAFQTGCAHTLITSTIITDWFWFGSDQFMCSTLRRLKGNPWVSSLWQICFPAPLFSSFCVKSHLSTCLDLTGFLLEHKRLALFIKLSYIHLKASNTKIFDFTRNFLLCGEDNVCGNVKIKLLLHVHDQTKNCSNET